VMGNQPMRDPQTLVPLDVCAEMKDFVLVEEVFKNKPLNLPLEQWKMNLMVMQPYGSTLFIACNDRIMCYKITDVHEKEEPTPYLVLEARSAVNQIKCATISTIPVLIVVNSDLGVLIYYTENLSLPPIRITNDESTWGVDSFTIRPYVAVSSNSHNITIFNLDTQKIEENKKMITGHRHNVPSISVSPDEDYIISCSIDKSFRIWEWETEKEIKKIELPQWAWGCLWINKSDVRDIKKDLVPYKAIKTFDTSKIQPSNLPQSPFFGKKPMGKTTPNPNVLSNYLIVAMTFNNIFLLDHNLNNLDTNFYALPRAQEHLVSFDRMAINFFIPKLSVIVSASQGGGCVLLTRVVKTETSFKLEPEVRLPYDTMDVPIYGMTYSHYTATMNSKEVDVFRLYILYQKMNTTQTSLFCYDLFPRD